MSKTIQDILEEFDNLALTELTTQEFIIKAIHDYEEAVKIELDDYIPHIYLEDRRGFHLALEKQEQKIKEFWKNKICS